MLLPAVVLILTPGCRTMGYGVLPFEQKGLVSVVDPREVADAFLVGSTHPHINTLVRWQEIRRQHNGGADGISAGPQLDRKLVGLDALLLRVACGAAALSRRARRRSRLLIYTLLLGRGILNSWLRGASRPLLLGPHGTATDGHHQ
jgi:hypothetical protein